MIQRGWKTQIEDARSTNVTNIVVNTDYIWQMNISSTTNKTVFSPFLYFVALS